MQVSKHSAEQCPAHDKKFLAISLNWFEKVESLAAKHGIKFLGSYDDHPAHTVYILYETPSMDNMMAFGMEPENVVMWGFCKGRIFPVFDHKQTYQMLKMNK